MVHNFVFWSLTLAKISFLDDFDDFQSAPAIKSSAPKQVQPAPKNDIFDLLGDDSTFTSAPTPQRQQQPNLMLSQGMTFETLVAGNTQLKHSPVIQPSSTPSNAPAKTTNSKPIGGIWSQASNLVMLDSLGSTSAPAKPTQGPSMNSLKNTSVNAGWNNWASANPSPAAQPQQTKQSSAFDDLLF